MPNKTFDLNRIVKSPETSTKMGGIFPTASTNLHHQIQKNKQ